ncbi:LTA synthase family protein, partial [Colidextribacter sp. OB.20]|uniref:LTA synthase family protein n=1 Tax=Colidextribacter sp. OB.20 TaxID=2304568 RepID=UPI001368F098
APGLRPRWAAMAAAVQLAALGLVLLCGGGTLSLRYIYYRAATPELEVQNFGVFTQTQLEVRRVLFGIRPDAPDMSEEPAPDKAPPDLEPTVPPGEDPPPPDSSIFAPETIPGYHTLPIDFDTLIANEEDEGLLLAHQWFSQRKPTPENLWTGYFQGKNLIWIVAEGFSTLAMDPQRTPALWKLSHQGFVFDNFYTPLWGLSTSDGEYVTTTGLIPKSGVWSYSLSSENYMPFALGNQLRKEGCSTFAFHNYLYDYYDRDKSHPNMGYDYYALGQGLELESGDSFPPSDLEMMEKIVPMFVNEERFAVYCLTVSGHLTYTLDTNAIAARHWDAVAGLPYSEEVRCYLACQLELELAVESLLSQLEKAGKLRDTVIVLSADHYPYGLTDEQYSELLGHQVDPVFELFQNTLILWSGDMEGAAVHVDKFCSSLDVLPTLSNLFGLPYDSRLIMGSDILSAADPLVIFANYSFISQAGYYNSITDQFTRWDGEEPDPKEVEGLVSEVQNRVAYSGAILDTDYYRLVLEHTGMIAGEGS